MRGPVKLALVAVLLASVTLTSCRSGPADSPATAPQAATRSAPREHVSVPPGLDPDAVAPFTGKALERAKLPLAAIVEQVGVPAYLAAATDTPADDSSDPGAEAEPPLAAQHAYLEGRTAWRQNNGYAAIAHLEQALRLAPNQPDILRLLGRIYTAVGNKVRGADHLRQALQNDPHDTQSLLLVGRFALEQGLHDEAIAAFHHLLQAGSPDGRRAQEPMLQLARYYLAAALAQAGYADAAAKQYERFLEELQQPAQLGLAARELTFIHRQQGVIWVALGDLNNRLNNPEDALRAYKQAQIEAGGEANALLPRLLYTHLRLGDDPAAEQLVISRIQREKGDAASLRLVEYLTENGVAAPQLADRLVGLYVEQGRSTGLAIAIADLLPPARGQQLLRDHLLAQPQDVEALQAYLATEFAADESDSSTTGHARAILLTAQLMAEAPDAAAQHAATLIDAAPDPRLILEASQELPASRRQESMPQTLRAIALAATGRLDDAADLLEQAMAAAPQHPYPRVQRARLAVLRGEYQQAGELLEPLADSEDPEVVALQVRVLLETGEAANALALLDRLATGPDAPTALILQKALLQQRTGNAVAAERTLLDALNTRPEEEAIYAALIQLYDPITGQSDIPDSERQWSRLVRRMLGSIPESRLARLVRAQIHDAQGEFDQAEALLSEVLAENPRDVEAVWQLVQVYVRSGRLDQAKALMEQQIQAQPENRATLMLARQFYGELEDRPRVLALTEKLLVLEPDSAQRARGLAVLFLATDRPAEAVDVLEEALQEPPEDPTPLLGLLWRALERTGNAEQVDARLRAAAERFPDHAADIAYQRSVLAERQGDSPRAQQILLDLLEEHPDHPESNNALGYAWTNEHKNLDRARELIDRALEAEPDNAAYLDSRGWVSYKLGHFDEAIVWLRRARAAEGGEYPVILDHLGDALYRTGAHDEAMQVWARALTLMQDDALGLNLQDDPELQGLEHRLQQKIVEAHKQGDPPLADVPEQPAP